MFFHKLLLFQVSNCLDHFKFQFFQCYFEPQFEAKITSHFRGLVDSIEKKILFKNYLKHKKIKIQVFPKFY